MESMFRRIHGGPEFLRGGKTLVAAGGAARLAGVNPDPADTSRLDQLAAVLASPVPRRPPAELLARVKNEAASLIVVGFGLFFAAFGSIFVALFFPWQLPFELRLMLPDVRTTEARIERVEKTNFSINKARVHGYEFHFSTPDGAQIRGRCYTTGPHWPEGAVATVRYVAGDPTVACLEGARLSQGGWISLLVLLFPAVGLGVAGYSLLERRRAERMLIHGTVAELRVTAVESTNIQVNKRPLFRIALAPADAPGAEPRVERRSDARAVRFAMDRLETGQPMFVLVDPKKPTRTLWIELY